MTEISADSHFTGASFDVADQYRFIWPGSHAMVRYLESIPNENFLDQKMILELGAGTGHLTCYLARRYHARYLVATEWSDQQLALLSTNITTSKSTFKTPHTNILVKPLDWNDIVSHQDLIWDEESARLVSSALRCLLPNNANAFCLLAFVVRSDYLLDYLDKSLSQNNLDATTVYVDQDDDQDTRHHNLFKKQRSIILKIQLK